MKIDDLMKNTYQKDEIAKYVFLKTIIENELNKR
jgi:hypothetical protein